MSCGIYKLSFNGTTRTYIGQSINIEKRYRQHILNIHNRTANYKILETYDIYGLPKLDILSECAIEDLDRYEEECIDIWDSVNSGCNIYIHSNQAPTYTGYGYGNSKYLKVSITKVFNLLVLTNKSFADIETLTDIPIATISSISALTSHAWLKEEYPDSYLVLKKKKGKRKDYGTISDKLSAKSKGIIYPDVISPEGIVYSIENAYKFAKLNNLAGNHFQEVLNGFRKSHKGWKLA